MSLIQSQVEELREVVDFCSDCGCGVVLVVIEGRVGVSDRQRWFKLNTSKTNIYNDSNPSRSFPPSADAGKDCQHQDDSGEWHFHRNEFIDLNRSILNGFEGSFMKKISTA